MENNRQPDQDPRKDWKYWVIPGYAIMALYKKDSRKFSIGLTIGLSIGLGSFVLILLFVILAAVV